MQPLGKWNTGWISTLLVSFTGFFCTKLQPIWLYITALIWILGCVQQKLTLNILSQRGIYWAGYQGQQESEKVIRVRASLASGVNQGFNSVASWSLGLKRFSEFDLGLCALLLYRSLGIYNPRSGVWLPGPWVYQGAGGGRSKLPTSEVGVGNERRLLVTETTDHSDYPQGEVWRLLGRCVILERAGCWITTK